MLQLQPLYVYSGPYVYSEAVPACFSIDFFCLFPFFGKVWALLDIHGDNQPPPGLWASRPRPGRDWKAVSIFLPGAPSQWETRAVQEEQTTHPNCRQGGRALSAEDLITISLIRCSSDFYHLVPTTLGNVNDKILLFGKKKDYGWFTFCSICCSYCWVLKTQM